jgi:hypothetical protein
MARTKQQHAVMQKKYGQPYHVILMDSAKDAIQGAVDENRYMPKEWYNIITAHPVYWDAVNKDWIQINTEK